MFRRLGSARWFIAILAAAWIAPAFAADGLQYPLAVIADAKGTVYVADRDLPGVWKFADGQLTIYFQGSKKFRTPLNAVRCLALDKDGKLLAGDSATREVYRFDDAAQPQPLTKGNVGIPMCLAVAVDGAIYASDLEIQHLVKIPAGGGEPALVAAVPAVRGMAFDKEGRLWAARQDNGSVVRFSADFQQQEVVAPPQFQFSHHLVFSGDGTAYVADGYAKTIWKLAGTQLQPLLQGDPLKNPVGLAWSEPHGLLVADPHQKAVYRVSADGKAERLIPGP
jgi:sugar lactone lactonase YvrE